jgi:hypothetical protein
MPNYTVESAEKGIQRNTTGQLTAVYRKSIPEGVTISTNYGALRDPIFRLYTEDIFSGNGSKSTFELNNDLVESPRMDAVDGDVVAFVDGTRTTDYTVDHANNEVTFDSAPGSASDNVEIFYIFNPGNIELVVEANDRATKTDAIVEEDIRAIHQVDQRDNPVEINTAHLQKPNNLALKLRSSVQVTDDPRAPHRVQIPYVRNKAEPSEVETYQEQLGSGV